MNQQTYDLNLFRPGDVVSISDIPDYQNITIELVSDSGVTISGPHCSSHIVLSGKTPARRATVEPKVESIKPAIQIVVPTDRAARGTYTDKMNNVKMPEGSLTFTIRQIAELNDIPQPYALKWVKENCVEAGVADKVEGQRGRAATLYSKI